MTLRKDPYSEKAFSLHAEAKNRGYSFTDTTYYPESDKLVVHGKRRDVIAYENGNWFTPEKAKINATKN